MTSKAICVLASPLPLIHSSPAPVASLNFSKQGKHIPAPGPLHCLLPGMPFPQISAWLSLPSRLCSHVSLSVRSFLIPLPKKHPLTFFIPLCCFTVFVVFASSWHVLKVFVYAKTNEVIRVPSVMEWQVCEVTCAFHSCIPASHPRAVLGGVHAPLTATFSHGPVVSTLGLWWEGAIFFFFFLSALHSLWDLSPLPAIEPGSSAVKRRALTPAQPENSLFAHFRPHEFFHPKVLSTQPKAWHLEDKIILHWMNDSQVNRMTLAPRLSCMLWVYLILSENLIFLL